MQKKNAVVFGANGGLGGALTASLVASGAFNTVFAVSRSGQRIDGAQSIEADPLDEESLMRAAEKIGGDGELAVSIVSIGILSGANGLQPERSYKQQLLESFERVFRINTFAPALIAKHILPIMPLQQRAVFAVLSARVGSILDNRLGGWHAYRASKTALNMLIKNYAIEQARRNKEFIAVGLHPGTVDTPLSEPFQKNVPQGKLFSAEQSAEYLIGVINGLEPGDSGKVFDWAGKEVPS